MTALARRALRGLRDPAALRGDRRRSRSRELGGPGGGQPARRTPDPQVDGLTGPAGATRLGSWPSCASPSPRSTPSSATSTATPPRSWSWSRQAADAGRPPRRVPRDGADRLPGRGPRAARVVRRRVPAGRCRRLAEQLADEGLGELRRRRRLPRRRAGRRARPGHAEGRAAERRRGRAPAAGWSARYAKHHLPNYGVFDEYRYFVPGSSLTVVRVHGVDVAVAICEDLWQEGGPVAVAREAGAGLLLVINGSPYERNKDDVRLDLVRRRAAGAGCALAYVNMVGGQDELVFDGDSLVVAADGERARPGAAVRRRAAGRRPRPAGGRRTADRRAEPRAGAGRLGDDDRAHRARPRHAAGLRAGDRDRSRTAVDGRGRGLRRAGHRRCATTSRKNGFRSVRARPVRRHRLGAGRRDRLRRARRGRTCYGVSMPSGYSSEHSRTDAADLAERTGLHFQTVPIAPMVDAFQGDLHLDRPGRGEPAGPGPRR